MNFSHLGFQGIREVYNVHPMFVHFPIALFPSALLLYFLGAVLKKPFFSGAGRTCLYLGTAGVLLAFLTGLGAQESFPHNATIHAMMQTHKAVGWMTLGLAGALTLWSFWQSQSQPKGMWAFVAVLAVTVLLILQTADIGSRMVFVEGAAVRIAVPLVAPAEEVFHHHGGASPGGHHENMQTPAETEMPAEAEEHHQTATLSPDHHEGDEGGGHRHTH